MLQVKPTQRDYLLPQLSSNVQAAVTAIYSFRHINPNYLGPVVQLRHGVTGETRDFYASSTGELRDKLSLFETQQTPEVWLGNAPGYISIWYDQVQVLGNATQPTSNRQPRINHTDRVQGYSASFEAINNNVLEFGTLTSFAGSNYSFFIRERRAKPIGSGFMLGTACNLDNRGLNIGYQSPSNIVNFGQAGNFIQTNIANQRYSTSNLEPIRRWFVGHHNSAQPGKHLYINGTLLTSNNNNIGLLSPHGQPIIGSAQEPSSLLYYDGDIYDVIAFNQSIPVDSPSNLQLIDRYFETTTKSSTLKKTSVSQISSAYDLIPNNSNLIGVYSLRQANPSYIGPLVQLRHGGTNELRDFYGNRTGTILVDNTSNPVATWAPAPTPTYIATWYDQSGSNRHATQATTARQPECKYSPSIGSYAALFGGSNQFLSSTVNIATSNYTCIIKERRLSDKPNNYFIGTAGTSNNTGLQLGYRFNYTATHTQTSNDHETLVRRFKTADTEPIRSFAFTQSSNAVPGKQIYINGELRASYSNNTPLASNTTLYLGAARSNTTPAFYYQGEIYEVLLFDTALSSATIASLANNHKLAPTDTLSPPLVKMRANMDTRGAAGIPPSILAGATAIYSTRKIVPSYKGPIFQLRHDTTQALADVFMNIDGVVTRVVPYALDDNQTSGGTITYDGAYKIHTFTANGTFQTQTARDVELLLVGGGGGGGSSTSSNPGGGGGGGEVVLKTMSLSPGSFPVIIGTGGPADTNGSNTTFYNFIAQGGGAGIGSNTGGSGGGGTSNAPSGGATTRYLGFATIGGSSGSNLGAGGGGGATTQGANATTQAGGNGGTGYRSAITGSYNFYGAGGGGGRFSTTLTNGQGGSNAASASNTPIAPPANFGGGGGGTEGSGAFTGGQGAAGVVILRTLRHPGFLGPDAINGWLQGANATVTKWYDQTSNQLHGFNSRSGSTRFSYNLATNDAALVGDFSAGMRFPTGVLPPVYTLFHTTKYNGPTQGRLINSTSPGGAGNWLSGCHGGKTGVAYHGDVSGWITNNIIDTFGPDTLVVHTDQNTPNMYRANGRTDLTINSSTLNSAAVNIAINDGRFVTNLAEQSDWLAKDVLVFPRTLSLKELDIVETALYRRILGPLDRIAPTSKLTCSASYSTLLTTNTYTGPVFKVKNIRTAAEQDFYANLHGDIGTDYLARGTPLTAWLAGDTPQVITWYDQTANNRHLTGIQATLQREQGIYYISLNSNLQTPATLTSPYTFETTFQTPSALTQATSLLAASNATIQLLTSGLLQVSETNAASTVITAASTASVSYAKWNHVLKTSDVTNQVAYLNGTQVITTTRPGGTFTTGNPVSLGSNLYYASARIYTAALSAFDIQSLAKTQGL